MKYEIEISQNPKYAQVIAEGFACDEGFINIAKDLMKHPDFEPGIAFLHDYQNIDATRISSQALRHVADFITSHKTQFNNGKWALVFNDDLGYGMARMWQAFTEINVEFQIKIFKNKAEALKWLIAPITS